jgi:hypothetical protein
MGERLLLPNAFPTTLRMLFNRSIIPVFQDPPPLAIALGTPETSPWPFRPVHIVVSPIEPVDTPGPIAPLRAIDLTPGGAIAWIASILLSQDVVFG